MKESKNSRRIFIGQASLTGLGTIFMTSIGCKDFRNDKKLSDANISNESIKYIGRKTLQEIFELEKSALFNRFIPNMESMVVDHDLGGFMCSVDIKNRKILSTNKSSWYEGRGIWTYSFLYNNFESSPKFLEIATKSKDFILKHRPENDNFWPSTYNREGEPLVDSGNIYGNLFIAEGLAEYAKASNDEKYFAIAKDIILSALKRYDKADYRYNIGYGPAGAKEIPAPRVLGHWMVFLRSATQILRHVADSDIQHLADRCIEAIMKYHLNSSSELLNEGLGHDFTQADIQWEQFAYLGHGIETLWMVMDEAVRRKDAGLFNEAGKSFKRHVMVATDALEGGFFRSLEHIDNHIFKTDKVLWLQEEVLVGALILMEHTDDDWAWTCFENTYEYIQDKFLHPEDAFITASGDRKMIRYQTNRAEHYHHPRRLMLNMLALERLIKTNGKPSGLFN